MKVPQTNLEYNKHLTHNVGQDAVGAHKKLPIEVSSSI